MQKHLLLIFSLVLVISCASSINFVINKTKYVNISSNNYNSLLMKIISKNFSLYNIIITTNHNSKKVPKLIINDSTSNLIVQPIDKDCISVSLCINIMLILSNKTICKTIKINHILIINYNFIYLEKIRNNLLLKYKFYQEFTEQLLLYIINYI
ncbi:MAG: hypothetical protein N4Q02_01775 [Candidatus Lightella neohaematopini]|nr:hypothetical protein [Candidatus Lightella neohaematopini]